MRVSTRLYAASRSYKGVHGMCLVHVCLCCYVYAILLQSPIVMIIVFSTCLSFRIESPAAHC